jgi:hypothetical protein
MPHVLGNAGGPPPPTRNETLLQAEVDRLRGELTAAQQVVEATRSWLRDGAAAGSTDVIRAVTTAVIAYDKVTGRK